MIEICRLTKRQIEPSKELPRELDQIKIFSMATGHGIGTVDFVECIGNIEEDEYAKIVEASNEYVKFKLGNITKYFEVEVFPEHAAQLHPSMPDCFLKEQFLDLRQGYIILRKPV